MTVSSTLSPGGVEWDFVTTNYVVSVLSMISVLLTNATIKSLLATVRQELIAAGAWQLGHEALCPHLGEIVSQRGESIAVGRASKCLDDVGVDFRGAEGIASGNVREAHEGVHQGELPWVVEPQSRDALSRRGNGRLREPS